MNKNNDTFDNKNKNLHYRAYIISKIRHFFKKKHVLEVETPMLTKFTVTDINLFPFKVFSEKLYNIYDHQNIMWLITSPEYHMKRLLSNGIGSIYQICHCFRSQEIGNYHNPEFTMLEWYQINYDMFDMINEVECFLKHIISVKSVYKISYQDIFMKSFFIDPLNTNIVELNTILIYLKHKHLINSRNTVQNILELIFTIGIEPKISQYIMPVIIYHYPIEQALLSRGNVIDYRISDRFEIFFQGIELGNGFCELIDHNEQNKRFLQENLNRVSLNLAKRSIDFRFLQSLSLNMPECSGVSIGLDRLMMIILKTNNINDVLSFSFDNC
ncbi:elongation factor P--(R)-beta-lysine ligase [Buchnera aphidicola]|uniref:Elongation factor P--(R)-beta-lysine ligase n=1 Tax=Buchnera aphidicola (Stegophylla sp.) TaxID=2315800 RepID=A0A4D6YBN5_9GAMM|nr:elongation factor P--(R)-beta-lysine ligase [Buchnera aphidicola (Stegophylla sp.)]QCI26522.1 elongation factor P--(R)-beta-lysine ligase [Buchnera aphidicola (Stegophylla sp.)]